VVYGAGGWRGERVEANEFEEGDGDGLAEIHAGGAWDGGDADEEMAVGHIVVGEAEFFAAEQEGDGAGMGADESGGVLEAMDGEADIAFGGAGGADDEGGSSDGGGEGVKVTGGEQDVAGVRAGAGFVGGDAVGLDQAEIGEAEVGHGAGDGANIEGIAGLDEDDAQIFHKR
jgi:hypothetical protein